MKTVRDVMSQDVICQTPNDTIQDAAIHMKEHDIGSVPICDDEKHVLGIVTDRDLVIRGYAKGFGSEHVLEEIMTTDIVTCDEHCELKDATDIMAKHQIRRLLVVKNHKLIGVVAVRDLILDESSDLSAKEAVERISKTI
ncbi:CBS domain-containing protein [Pelagirhabdus alkalitolerans]|uniref:CBS domain-containing protein n=1 Tax=Pelagirhabdus alkalitolerans TaxID=1612202 RepID=A0A1G6GZA7_9BACI|nr:CBS domain-containing protein [Pelagirhabdus alkalitolerans]SDB87362.1 CBS domain-containing protein [Pelagirhabdus alkalitolerans]